MRRYTFGHAGTHPQRYTEPRIEYRRYSDRPKYACVLGRWKEPCQHQVSQTPDHQRGSRSSYQGLSERAGLEDVESGFNEIGP